MTKLISDTKTVYLNAASRKNVVISPNPKKKTRGILTTKINVGNFASENLRMLYKSELPIEKKNLKICCGVCKNCRYVPLFLQKPKM